ncbi:MAG TPA: FAD-binding oxidoreductase [Ktedonobacterales bacterium]|nr:FAD-binding oxidoreductase [Ktedonobacterales bacterium]
MPRRYVIIGAGILGAALAARLADSDASVTVVEAEQPGQGTSASSLAWVNANGKPPRAYHDLNVAGIRAWRERSGQLGGDWFRPGGSLRWTAPADSATLAEHVAMLTGWEYPARLLTPAEALQLEPELAIPPDVREVAYFPEEAYLLTRPAIRDLLAYATARGVTLVTGDAVIELLATGDRVHGVRLASGAVIEAETVVLCAGWRTPSLAAQLGVVVPLIPVDAPGSPAPCIVAWTEPTSARLSRYVSTPDLEMRPAEQDRLLLEAGDLDTAMDLATDASQLAAHAQTYLERARRYLPALAGTRIAEYKVCVRPLPADGYSIVGRAPTVEGCYVLVTHSGVTLAAHLATLVSSEILTGREEPTLAPYRLQRFAAASPSDTTPPARH